MNVGGGQTSARTRAAPRLSVVVPTHDRPRQLGRLLDALLAQLDGRDAPDVEVLVVDDHSRPADAQALRACVRAHRQSTLRVFFLDVARGPAAARNRGAAESSGEIVAFLDDDCVPRADYVGDVIRVHAEHPDACVVSGELRPLRDDVYSLFWFSSYRTVFHTSGEPFARIGAVSGGNFSIKRRVLQELSPLFDESLPSREDFDLALRLGARGVDLYKTAGAVAHHDCRDSLWSLVRQRIWYARGERRLRRKHGARAVANQRRPRAWTYRGRQLWIALLLGFAWHCGMAYWGWRDGRD